MPNYKATIVILDYMKARQVVDNVNSILAQELEFPVKIIVVDNSCNSANAETLNTLAGKQDVELVVNKKNLGYGGAHNAVSHLVEGEYIFIVNPDIIWTEKNSLQKMIDYMDAHEEIGILGPKQINVNDNLAMSVRAFPRFYVQVARRTFLRHLPWIKNVVEYDEMKHLDYDKVQDVDWLQSSCVLIRKKLWDELGGFNEKYFLFMADVEICFEAWKKGYSVVYFPEVVVRADGKRLSAGGFMKFFQSWVMRQHVLDSMRYRVEHLFCSNPRQIRKKRN